MAWELLKAMIRSECMLYSGTKDNETNKPLRFTLERELTHLSALISRSPTDHSLITDYENCKKKSEIAELARTKGAIVRSMIKWMEEGERNTTQSIKLKMNKGQYVNIRPKFYQRFRNISKTYIKKDEAITNVEEQLNDFMQHIQHEVRDEENKEFCDSKITTKEMSEVLNCLNNKLAPGSDGLTADFYKVSWKSLKRSLYDSFTQSIEQSHCTIALPNQ